jgi:hypothetical protein
MQDWQHFLLKAQLGDLSAFDRLERNGTGKKEKKN